MSTVWLPTVEGPKDLPDLRGWLLDHWKPGTVIADIFTDAPWVRRTLQSAHLWWIEEGACDVLANSAPTIPADHVLDLHDLPTPSGLAILASDLEGIDADPTWDLLDGKVRLSGIMWGPVAVKVAGDPNVYEGISIGSFSRSIFRDHNFSQSEMVRAYPTVAAILAGAVDKNEYARLAAGEPVADLQYPSTGDVFSYLGRSDWLTGAGPDELLPGDDQAPPATLRSKAEDRRLLAALWALTRTSITEVTTAKLPRPVVRRAQRAGTDPTVRVLSLGGERLVHRGDEPATPTTREYRHSWIVSPHFRWQACGPGRADRRLILVPAYLKGDPAMPLLGTDRVWRVLPPRDGG